MQDEIERRRKEFLASFDEARASLALGKGRVITPESMHQLVAKVSERRRARLLAELAQSR